VYRALRSINPSLIFFFDYGDFKIFGSSPEAQIIVKTVKPKSILLQELLKEQVMMKRRNTSQRIIKIKKENSEHVMLVDLAVTI
jgi:anthranilate synthase component 1